MRRSNLQPLRLRRGNTIATNMMTSWLRSLFIWAIILNILASSCSAVGDTKSYNVMGKKRVALVSSGTMSEITSILEVGSSSRSSSSIPTKTKQSSYGGTIRGGSQHHQQQNNGHRRTQDIEDMLQDMAGKDPSEWSPIEWFIMILFLSFFGWLGCCLCTLCCCGSRSSDICAWLCFWEICCRGGSDIDRCCDVYGPLA